jgi:hypothetical protein
MKDVRRRTFFFFMSFLSVSAVALVGSGMIFSSGKSAELSTAVSTQTAVSPAGVHQKPKYVRGVHLTAWVAGSQKLRQPLEKLIEDTELNTLVIDIKEYEGEIYLPGYKKAEDYKSFTRAVPDFEKYIAELKKKNIYLVARIVVFKDNFLPKKRPDLAVKDANGGLWKDRAGLTWVDPYNRENWDYNIGLAEQAIKMGFDEIQFDYIRFPSDGNMKNCRYSQKHSSTTASAAIVGFLEAAHERIKPTGAYLSIDVFGLTTTVSGDMGIGQKIVQMTKWADFVSPMVYPSHYAKGEYGIPDPNKAPYHTVYLSLESAKRRIPPSKLRPYLQDFSLGAHYGAKEILEQVQACYDNDIPEWLLWNPRCVYTRQALKGKGFSDKYEKKPLPSYIKERKIPAAVRVSTSAAGVELSTAPLKGNILDAPTAYIPPEVLVTSGPAKSK